MQTQYQQYRQSAAHAAKILVSIAAIVVAPEPRETVTELVPPTPKVNSSRSGPMTIQVLLHPLCP